MQNYTIRKINTVTNEILESLIYSQFSQDGVFGFEYMSDCINSNLYMFAPTFHKIEYGKETNQEYSLLNDMDKLICYEIVMIHPSFFPLNIQKNINLIDLIVKETTKTSVFFQMLFTKKKNNWKKSAIEQYRSFLRGNNVPSDIMPIRKLQDVIITKLDKFTNNNHYRKQIEDIENKIIDDGYKIEMRILLKLEADADIKNNIQTICNKLNYFNKLKLIKLKLSKRLINNITNRQFSFSSRNQFVNASELKSILLNYNTSHHTIFKQEVNISDHNENNNDKLSQMNKIINILPGTVKRNKREINQTLPSKIVSSLKRVGIIKTQEVVINKFEQGNTLQKITINIPKGINYSDIEKQYKNIKAVLGVESLAIEQGDEPETISFLLPVDEREIVYLKDILNNNEFIEYTKNSLLPFILGVDVLGKPLYYDLTFVKHLLIAGGTGSGKSVLLNAIIMSLISTQNSSDLMIYLIDPKKVEFIQYNGISHIREIVTDMTEAKNLLYSLTKEMDNRYTILAEKGYKDIKGYNKNNENKIPYIVCIVDEFNDLIMTAPSDVESYIVRLSQKARAAGIHLIIATQRPEVTVITGLIKANLTSKISLRLDSVNDYRTIFGKGIPYQLLGSGDGVMRIEGQIKEFERFQAPIITLNQDEEMKIYDQIRKVIKQTEADTLSKIEIEENNPVTPMDKLKHIIATTKETRVAKIREQMGIRSNDVQDLMQILVNEGWLEAPQSKNKGYQLIADEKMLNEWL